MNDFALRRQTHRDPCNTRVFYIDAIGYELAPVVVSSAELEARLQPLYERLHCRRASSRR